MSQLPPALRSVIDAALSSLPPGCSDVDMLRAVEQSCGAQIKRLRSAPPPAPATVPAPVTVLPPTPVPPPAAAAAAPVAAAAPPGRSLAAPAPASSSVLSPATPHVLSRSESTPPPSRKRKKGRPPCIAGVEPRCGGPATKITSEDADEPELPRQDSVAELSTQVGAVRAGGMVGGGGGMFTHYEDVELGDRLGEGAFGVVYCGRVRFAVKVLELNSAGDELPSLETELAYIRKFHEKATTECKYIVRAFDAFYLREMCQVRIVLEFMDVGSLKSVITARGGRSRPIPPRSIAAIAFQTATALAYLHGLRELHRDLKPDNLLLNRRGLVKISDFGTTREVSGGYATTVMGTLLYMSPEKLRGERYKFPDDVWSLGLCVAEAALGEFPYPFGRKDGAHHERGYFAQGVQIQEPPPDLCRLPTDMGDLIQRLLLHDPRMRLPAADVLRHPFVVSHLQHEDPAVQKTAGRVAEDFVREDIVKPLEERTRRSKQAKEAEEAKKKRAPASPSHQGVPIAMPTSRPPSAAPARPRDEPIPESNITLEKPLSEGAFGRVFVGWLHKTEVAVKELKQQSEEELRKFILEIEHTKNLRHQQIVTYYGYSIMSGRTCLVLEYCRGGNLHTLLRSYREGLKKGGDRMKLSVVARMCDDVCNALYYLHCLKVTHRDIAARNIFVGKDGNSFKVGDLGLAREYETPKLGLRMLMEVAKDRSVLSALNIVSAPAPTPEEDGGRFPFKWASPEVFQTEEFTPASDVWALGCTIWEVFHYGARSPWDVECAAGGIADVFAAVCRGQKLEQPLSAPNELWEAVVGCFYPFKDRPSADTIRWRCAHAIDKVCERHKKKSTDLAIPVPSMDPAHCTFACFADDMHPWHEHPLPALSMNKLRGWSQYLCLVCRVKKKTSGDDGEMVRICQACGYYMCSKCFDLTRAQGGSLTGTFEGTLVAGKASGEGKLVSANGTFVGEFKHNDYFNGTMTYKNGWTYSGEWKAGAKHGVGCDRSNEQPDPKRYKFREGGSQYEGDFRYNRRHGKGKMLYAYAEEFDGIWKDDKRQSGKYTFGKVAVVRQGVEPRRPVRSGARTSHERWIHLFGLNHNTATCRSCGKFPLNLPEWFRSNGGKSGTVDLCTSCWEAGEFPDVEFTDMGALEAEYPWDSVYEGEFDDNNNMSGVGTLTYPDGRTLAGFWRRNEYQGSDDAGASFSCSATMLPTMPSYELSGGRTESFGVL